MSRIMEKLAILFTVATVVQLAASFDLGPTVRIAQCRSECLRNHSIDGSCDFLKSSREQQCSECWNYCETVENTWESNRYMCQGLCYLTNPACRTACQYRMTRVAEEILPSSLKAPSSGPVQLGRDDVAVLFRKTGNRQWKVSGYYPGSRPPTLRPDTWILGVLTDGIQHYSWEEWTPSLESLKEGPLVEATISWRDLDEQLQRQRILGQKQFNDRVRQFYLEKYGEKVLDDEVSAGPKIPEDVFRRFFFRSREEDADPDRESLEAPAATLELEFSGRTMPFRNPLASNKVREPATSPPWVVSWEPEGGGLMGNQIADSNYAQITLLPGTKYLVRIASNDGPGSFPIIIDTRTASIQIRRIRKIFRNGYTLAIVTGCAAAGVVLLLVILAKLCCGSKRDLQKKAKECTVGV